MKFKHKKDELRFEELAPALKHVVHELAYYCAINGKELVITATWTSEEEDRQAGRKSDTHRTFRAVDISVKDWDKDFQKEVTYRFSRAFSEWGALISSKKDGSQYRSLMVFHGEGANYHLHVQVRRDHHKLILPYSKEGEEDGKDKITH
jgi:hypothetical protein